MKQIAQMSNYDGLLMISYWRRVPAIDHSRVEATSRVDLGGLVGASSGYDFVSRKLAHRSEHECGL